MEMLITKRNPPAGELEGTKAVLEPRTLSHHGFDNPLDVQHS